MAVSASAAITLNPRINSAETARKEMFDFVKNPPKDPISAVKKFGDMLGVGAVVSAGITAAFPFAAPILPVLSGIIFDLFSAGPSLGELTLDAINNLSGQLSEGLKNLQEAVETIAKEEAQRTIDVVLQGADAIAREQNAVEVMNAITAAKILEETYQQKNLMYVEFLAQMQDYRKKTLDDLAGSIDQAQENIQEKYNQLLVQVYSMIGELAPALLDSLDNFITKESAGSPEASTRELDQDTQSIFSAPGQSTPGQKDSQAILIVAAVAAGGVAFMLSQKKGKK